MRKSALARRQADNRGGRSNFIVCLSTKLNIHKDA